MTHEQRSSVGKFLLLAVVALGAAALLWFGGEKVMNLLRSLHGH